MTVYIQHAGAGRCSHMVRHPGNMKKQLIENKGRISDWGRKMFKPVSEVCLGIYMSQFILTDMLAAAQCAFFPSKPTLIKRR